MSPDLERASKESVVEIKEAISKAKEFVANVMSDEEVSQIRLEEAEFDDREDAWLITLGVMRPSVSKTSLIPNLIVERALKRSYKIVKVPNHGGKLSLKIRIFDETE
jgi:hypothetical protein